MTKFASDKTLFLKKLLMKHCCFLLLLIISVFFSCQNQPKPQLFAFTDSLKLRDSASVNSKLIGYLHKSYPVIYKGEKGDSLIALIEGNLIFGQWLKVETDSGNTGWVFSGGLDFDSTEINYGVFNALNAANDSILLVPDEKKIPVYQLPQLSSKKLHELEGLREILVTAEDTITCPVTGVKRAWVSWMDDQGNPGYILKSNLIKRISNEISPEEFKKTLIKMYDPIEEDEGYEFKSLKRFENGDDGAEWTEESELTFNFDGKYIIIGYMYTYATIKMDRIIRNKNKFTIGTKPGQFSKDKIIELELNNGFIKVYNAGELSVKYVPGKADNY
jgi:hypothetical protein